MERILVITLLTLTTSPLALSQTTGQQTGQGQTSGAVSTAGQQSSGDVQEFKRLYDEMDQASMRGDKAVIERMFADDVTVVNQRGILRGKKDVVGNVRTPSAESKTVSSTYNDMRVRRYGDTAVVTYLFDSKRLDQGKEVARQFRITDVWVKKEGRWQIVAAHLTSTEQQPTEKKP